ncbi:MAG: thermonuclease family protein [Myxococcales bacterium]|nr:thermonuclease family protein [Myxococcales bacterium]
MALSHSICAVFFGWAALTLTCCANTRGEVGVDASVTQDSADGAEAKSTTPTDPDELDLLAPVGVCEAAGDWFNVGFVLDADTVTIDDGYAGSVRLLGVAAPEIAHGSKPAECYGVKAWQTVKQWLPEGAFVKVCAKADPNADDKDTFGRRLRYVYFKDGKGRSVQLNARVIRRGQGRLYRAFSSGLALEGVFAESEKAAQAEDLGGWKECSWTPL